MFINSGNYGYRPVQYSTQFGIQPQQIAPQSTQSQPITQKHTFPSNQNPQGNVSGQIMQLLQMMMSMLTQMLSALQGGNQGQQPKQPQPYPMPQVNNGFGGNGGFNGISFDGTNNGGTNIGINNGFGNGGLNGISFDGANNGGTNIGINNGFGNGFGNGGFNGISFDGINNGGNNIGINNGFGFPGFPPVPGQCQPDKPTVPPPNCDTDNKNNPVIINNNVINNYFDFDNDNCKPPVQEDCKPKPPACPPPKYDGGNDGRCWGDPHLEGFDGEKYDVMGQAGKTYNMLSDKDVQYNTKFAAWGEKDKDGVQPTIMSEAGLQVGTDRLFYDVSGKPPTLNGKPMDVGQVTLADGTSTANWNGTNLLVNTSEYNFDFKAVDHAKGDYLDNKVTINQNGPFSDYVAPHGLLGQTADGVKGKKNTGVDQGKQGGNVIDGTVKDYEVKDLWNNDFTYNRFGAEVGKTETDAQGNVSVVYDANGNILYEAGASK